MQLLIERSHELFIFRRDDRQLSRRPGRHELAEHGLEIVLRNEPADDEIILALREPPLG